MAGKDNTVGIVAGKRRHWGNSDGKSQQWHRKIINRGNSGREKTTLQGE